MIERILRFSIQWRILILILGVATIGIGLYIGRSLPIDAVPDITSNQVQINTVAPAFAPLEMEKYVTLPLEVALSSLPRKEGIRSVSQFGLSQVTVTFHDNVDIYWARQLVLERLIEAERALPPGVVPELAPISTGLGEIYQFTVESDAHHSPMELRTLLDWFIKPQLRTVPGVIEVNSFGGLQKQYEVLIDPNRLVSYGLSVHQVISALEQSNMNAGGGYLERGSEQQLLRGIGLIQNIDDIRNIVVASPRGVPVYIRDLATVGLGSPVRQGAATRNGNGETVMGIAMLLKGENSRAVARAVADKIAALQNAMPPGVKILTYYDRTKLVNRTIRTAVTNLIEGGVLVVFILLLFLLQARAGLIVSSVIPMAMLIAIIGMRVFGISANLMSLGAIDFGLIVDAAVIIVENCVRRLAERRSTMSRPLSKEERLHTILGASSEVRRASQFGELIIIVAYIPVLSLVGIEGKMFQPMALTVIFALTGALLLSLTLVPALCAVFLKESHGDRENKIVASLKHSYRQLLQKSIPHRKATVGFAAVFVLLCSAMFLLLGMEFLPELDEGAIAINHVRLKSVSLTEAVRQTTRIENAIKRFPEVETIVSRIGRPEIATDPMGPDMADTYVFLKPKSQWTTVKTKEELVGKIHDELEKIPGAAYSFSQPIKFRMMELIEGVGSRSDLAIKIYGDDLGTLRQEANAVGRMISSVSGAEDVKVQQVTGLPTLEVRIKRDAIARYGLNISDVQEVIQTAIAGTTASTVLEGSMRFDLAVRFPGWARNDPLAIAKLLVVAPNGQRVPLDQVAEIQSVEGPSEVSRENGQRRISVEANVRGRDIGSFVTEARRIVDQKVKLPPGYMIEWGGMWEHLESGRNRLLLAIPVTFFIILLLLFITFNSLRHAALVFTGIPFAVTGGVLALLLREMNFSMSAGVGFIAVSGVAVLNGIVMLACINQLRQEGVTRDAAVIEGALTRLRPVLMTALVASLGFVPMALATGTGAEVQRPLATVVIGGLMTSTLLTLIVLPNLYCWFEKDTTHPGTHP